MTLGQIGLAYVVDTYRKVSPLALFRLNLSSGRVWEGVELPLPPSERIHPENLHSPTNHSPTETHSGEPPDPMNFMQKPPPFYTLFRKTLFQQELRQTGYFPLSYKTLIDAFGGQISQKTGWDRSK
jgi:hypothetical protein